MYYLPLLVTERRLLEEFASFPVCLQKLQAHYEPKGLWSRTQKLPK